jgi:hypothetical protein
MEFVPSSECDNTVDLLATASMMDCIAERRFPKMIVIAIIS